VTLLRSFATILLLFAGEALQARSAPAWSASWAASPAPPLAASKMLPAAVLARAFSNQTVDQAVRLSVGGSALRVRLTNEYGEKSLRVGAARVALLDEAGKPIPGTERALTFAGAGTTVIPPRAPWVSDPIAMTVPTRARLRISLYFPDDTGLCTCHAVGGETATISPPGDFTDLSFQPVGSFSARAFISAVDVGNATPRPVIVTFGDSITDGFQSSADSDRRWPDRLAERLAANKTMRDYGVVNAAISGNRILSEGFIPLFGDSAVARFDRDVLSLPGARTVILLEGINDIGQGSGPRVTADALIGGYRQIIARAHARGLKIIGGTMLPYEGAAYYRPEGNAVRKTVNLWIMTSGAFDGTIDFDKVMRDPASPDRLRADLQSGDWLHPNDAGYRAMGDAVPLSLLR